MTQLKPKQVEAAFQLSCGKSKMEVAEALGVHSNSIFNWMKIAEFQALVNQLQHERIADAQDILRAAALPASEAIASIVRDASADMKTKLAAARLILDYVGLGAEGLTYRGPSDPQAIEKQARVANNPLLKLLPEHYQ